MTLITALKYKGGTVLASDSRVMIGELKRDCALKLEPLTKDIGIAAAGLLGVTNDILEKAKAYCSSTSPISFENFVTYLSDTVLDWHKRNAEKLEEEEEGYYYVFIAVSPERIRKVLEKGYSEEVYDYDCDGTGKPYAEYILGNLYRKNLDEEEAKELAVHAILETSKMDPNVGEDIELLVFPKGKLCKVVGKQETEEIKARLAPMSRAITEEQIKSVEKIVTLRENINDLFNAKFKFKLFSPNEKAIFQIMKPCRSEGEFTSNVAALALLVEQMNVTEMKKVSKEKEGSINILEDYLRQYLKEFPSEIIAVFRDIMTMRSKKFPIHTTDPKFVDVVIRMTGQYPPLWTDLYIRTLNAYRESLNKLVECLSKKQKPKQ
jgi:20S proteasome alpha/beta subunit